MDPIVIGLIVAGVIIIFVLLAIKPPVERGPRYLHYLFRQTEDGWVLVRKHWLEHSYQDNEFFASFLRDLPANDQSIYVLTNQSFEIAGVGECRFCPEHDLDVFSGDEKGQDPHLQQVYTITGDWHNSFGGYERFFAKDDRDALQRFFFSDFFWDFLLTRWTLFRGEKKDGLVVASGFGPRVAVDKQTGNLTSAGKNHPLV